VAASDIVNLTVGKWGNNFAVRFDKELSTRYNIKKGDTFAVELLPEGMFFKPLAEMPKPKVELEDIRFNETLAVDPDKIDTIHLIHDKNFGYVLRIATRLAKVTIEVTSLLKLDDTLSERIKVNENKAIMICLSQIKQAAAQANKAQKPLDDALKIWESCGIVWKNDQDPMKSPDFLSRLSNLKNQMKLDI
jgi:antitoxin component of MazEF toxin-antitoxin module